MFASFLQRAFVLLFGIALAAMPAASQPVNVRLDAPDTNPEEVTIAINPLNPDNIVAGSNLKFFYTSFDAGKTWTQGSLPDGTWGDPCVIFDKTGRVYIANLRYGWDAIAVRHSDDGGRTWSAAVKLFGPSSDSARAGSLFKSSLQDKEWLVCDMTDGPRAGSIYASWTDFTKYGSEDPKDSSVIVFARSLDRGETFEPFVRVSDKGGDAIDSDNTVEGAVPAVGPDGSVYLAWAGPEGLYFDRSFDGGQTWGTDRVISDMPGGWDLEISGISRSNGLPITLADISDGAHSGTIYINWVDLRNGDPDVFILSSTDGGDTWRGPVRVNDDVIGNGKDQFFTWATTDPVTGELSVVFYDRRSYDTDSTDVYLARSTDGGLTFDNQRISQAAFYPSPMVFFGDYNGISAYDGRIRPIWTQLDQGQLSIHTCLIEKATNAINPLPASMRGVQLLHWPNPASSVNGSGVNLSLTIERPSVVEATIHDLVGRCIATVTSGFLEAGEHRFTWSAAGLDPGVYLYRASVQGNEGGARVTGRLITVL